MNKGLIIFDFDGTLGDTRRGNGTKEELEKVEATFIIDRMDDLIEIVNKEI